MKGEVIKDIKLNKICGISKYKYKYMQIQLYSFISRHKFVIVS